MQMTFMNASLFDLATPLAGRATARSTSAADQLPCASSPASAAISNTSASASPPMPASKGAGASASADAADQVREARVGPVARRRSGLGGSRGALRTGGERLVIGRVRLGPADVPAPHDGELDRQVVDLRRLGRAVGGEAQQQRAFAA